VPPQHPVTSDSDRRPSNPRGPPRPPRREGAHAGRNEVLAALLGVRQESAPRSRCAPRTESSIAAATDEADLAEQTGEGDAGHEIRTYQ